MKNLLSSDINLMVQNTMTNASVRLTAPVSTSAIWGLDAFAGRSSAIWGTSGIQGVNRAQNFSAIWGTCPFRAPAQQIWAEPVFRIERPN